MARSGYAIDLRRPKVYTFAYSSRYACTAPDTKDTGKAHFMASRDAHGM
jgi:hypothetical protein